MKKYRIGELGEIFTGNTPSKKNNEFYESEDIMFIKPDILSSNITIIKQANEYLSEKAREKARIIPKGSLLVSCIGNIGKLGINIEEVAFNQQINAIVHNSKISSSKYLAYLLRYNQKKLEFIANAPVVPIINKSQFSNFELLIHEELEVQSKIVEILDKAQELIDKRKEQIKTLDELVKSKFIKMFGDILQDDKFDKVILKEVANVGSSKRIYANEYVESGIPFYRSKEIRELGENLKPSIELFISEEKYDSIKNQFGVPKKGDILIAAIGATIGYTWIVNTDEAFYYKDGNLLNVSINKSMNSIYLNHALKILINDFKYKGASGTAQLALTIEKVGKMEVTCPPIELQNQFADFVKQVDKLKFEMEKSLKELEDNFNSLMQKAFKGELFN